MQAQSKPIAEIVAAIQELDLEPIKVKLMDAEEGQGWPREYVDRMEVAYKRFLTLVVRFPEETIAPNKDIDTFWHGHILDTMKYAEDCQNAFGYFLHHFPYFGMRGQEDAANLAAAGRTMDRLYEREFGEKMPTSAATVCGATVQSAVCGASEPAVCGASVQSRSAVCGAAKPAVCGASVQTAVSGAAKSAVCGASVQSKSAVCGAAKPTVCGASVQSRTAVCGAAAPVIGAALNTSVRPTFKLAA
jgi:uncharacterized protein DUF1399